MLVLTRKLNESIMIGEEIEVRIARIDSDCVKIGIEAPRRLTIYRNEIYRQIKAANLGAARPTSAGVPLLPQLPLPSV